MTSSPLSSPTRSCKSRRLSGRIAVPGDKSVSHRSLMLGAIAIGETRIEGLLEGEDVVMTANAVNAMGASATREGEGLWRVKGVGVGALTEPEDILDMGNAGTGARLLLGLIGGQEIRAVLTGDASLRRRPMDRVADPLRQMGVRIETRSGGRLPAMVIGPKRPMPIRYKLPVPSAQVKSAIMLAGLSAPGDTVVIEPEPTRDHTERMLRHFGATVTSVDGPEGREVTLVGQPELVAADIVVPGDPSSAAFPIAAGLLADDGEVTVTGVGLNPLRTGLLTTLEEMGANLRYQNRREAGGEPVADIVVKPSELKGISVPAERAPSMIDEYPILAVIAARASGTTHMEGLAELRVKESDRLAAIAAGLIANGVSVETGPDHLRIRGDGGPAKGGGTVLTHLDHRIAMSFLIMGLSTEEPVTIDDAGAIATSFPGFVEMMRGLGAEILPAS